MHVLYGSWGLNVGSGMYYRQLLLFESYNEGKTLLGLHDFELFEENT